MIEALKAAGFEGGEIVFEADGALRVSTAAKSVAPSDAVSDAFDKWHAGRK